MTQSELVTSVATIDLKIRDEGGVPLVNSRAVAEHFQKEHRNVLRSIDALSGCSELSSLSDQGVAPFRLVRVQDEAANKGVRTFDMTREGFTLLAMGWTGIEALRFKVAYIAEFNRMEAALRSAAPAATNLNDPHALRAALLTYADQVIALTADNDRLTEESGVLGAKVEYLAPKAAALDLLCTMAGEQNLAKCAKSLGRRPDWLFSWLHVNDWLFKRTANGYWRAFQDKIDGGYMVERERPDRNREDVSHLEVMITPKGRAQLAGILAIEARRNAKEALLDERVSA